MTIEREIIHGIELMLHGSPQQALAAYRRLVEHDLPWLERRAVYRARGEGFSWAGIGRLLGCSRQAVRKRFGELPTVDEMLFRHRRDDPNEAAARYYAKLAADVRRDLAADDADDAVPW